MHLMKDTKSMTSNRQQRNGNGTMLVTKRTAHRFTDLLNHL